MNEKEKIPVIEVKNLYKVYRIGQNKVYALNGVDMTVYKGEFCSIVGTSGSGKSTMLNMLAGLEKPTKGTIKIAGKYIEKLSERQLVKFRRDKVGFIFQSFNLLGTMNAVENVALPLSFRGIPKKIRLKKASAMLDLVGLKKQKKHKPNQMSGGQQQRVGVARALVVDPEIIDIIPIVYSAANIRDVVYHETGSSLAFASTDADDLCPGVACRIVGVEIFQEVAVISGTDITFPGNSERDCIVTRRTREVGFLAPSVRGRIVFPKIA